MGSLNEYDGTTYPVMLRYTIFEVFMNWIQVMGTDVEGPSW